MQLRFGDFRFIGFDDPQAEFERATRSGADIEPGWPSVSTATDAVSVPYAWAGGRSGDAPSAGGLHNLDGSVIAEAEHLRYPLPWTARAVSAFTDDLPVIDEEVIYAGVYFQHFGHFTLETMSRLWLVAREQSSARVLVHNLEGFPREPHAREIFVALGLDDGRLLAPRHPVRLRSVRMPGQAFVLNRRAYEGHRQTFTTIGARMGTQQTPETDQPLYLSRSALARHQRRIINEPILEEVLERNGFRVFRPERHSLREQLEVAHRHKYLFGPWGSAFRSALFSPRTKLACQFVEAFPKVNFLMEARLSGAQAWFVKGTGYALMPGKRAWETALWFDLERILGYLHAEGFVGDVRIPQERVARCVETAAVESIFVHTYALARRGRYEELALLEQTLGGPRAEPAHQAAFRCALAEAELAGGNAARAEALLRLVTESGRADARTSYLLSMALTKQGRIEDAIASAGEAVALEPHNAGFNHHLGNLLRRQGDLSGAEVAQRKALRSDPKFVAAFRQLAGILAESGDLLQAVAVAREAVSLDRYDADLICDLASLLARSGLTDEAEQRCLAALRLDGDCVRAQKQLRQIRKRKALEVNRPTAGTTGREKEPG